MLLSLYFQKASGFGFPKIGTVTLSSEPLLMFMCSKPVMSAVGIAVKVK